MATPRRVLLGLGAGLNPGAGGLRILEADNRRAERASVREEDQAQRMTDIQNKFLLDQLSRTDLDEETFQAFSQAAQERGLVPEGLPLSRVKPGLDIDGPLVNLQNEEGEITTVRRDSPETDELVRSGHRLVSTTSGQTRFDPEDAILRTQQILDEGGELETGDQRARDLAVSIISAPRQFTRVDPDTGEIVSGTINPQIPDFLKDEVGEREPIVLPEKPKGPTRKEIAQAKTTIKEADSFLESSRDIVSFIKGNPGAVGVQGIAEQALKGVAGAVGVQTGPSSRTQLAAKLQILRSQANEFKDKGNLNAQEQKMLDRVLVGLNALDTPADAIAVQQIVQEFVDRRRQKAKELTGESVKVLYARDKNDPSRIIFSPDGGKTWKDLQ